MKRSSVLFGLCLAVLLAVPTLVCAANPGVHYFDCNKCHLSGYTATQMSNNQVCLQCHKSSALDITLNPGAPASLDGHTDGRLDIGDASNALGHNSTYKDYETSHNWAAPDTQPAAGAQAPNSATYPGFYSRYGASHGKVTCTRCHNPHGEASLGTNPLANPKLLIRDAANANKPMDPEKMCRACHVLYASQEAGNHGRYGHPVPAASYTDVIASQSSDYKTAAEVAAAAGASKATLIGGKVTCLSCHGIHFTDSDSTTADVKYNSATLLNQGDGLMLRGDGMQFVNDPVRSTTFCNTCHEYEGGIHGDGTTSIGCLGCHGGHNNTGASSPYFMLNGNYPTLPTEYGGTADRNALWGGSTAGVDGFCESCHGDISDTTTPAPINSVRVHVQGEECSSCHSSHADGAFSQATGCDGCHGSPPQVSAPGNATAGGYVLNGYAWAPQGGQTPVDAAAAAAQPNPYSYQYANGTGAPQQGFFKNEVTTPHTSHSGSTSRYKYTCGVCHNATFGTTHNKGNGSFQDVLEAGYAYDSKSVAPGAANPAYNDGLVTGTCSNVYCHSNGGVNTGAGARTFGFTAASWATATKNTIVGTGNECGNCHGNDATDMVTKANSTAHIEHLNAGFSCNSCHTSTAASATAYQGAGIPATHLNKSVDIAFTTAALKAGGAVATFPAGSWNGAATPTCDTVYCHSNGNLNNLQYRTISWTAGPTNLSCTACHDINAGADRTAAHQVHVNGATSDVGRNLDCGVCHDDTMDVGNNTTITGAAKHVNGMVDIKMNIFGIDTGACSNISCHSDGNFDGTVAYSNAPWTGSPLGGCNDCHGVSGGVTYPSYNSAGLGNNSNSHQEHVGGGIGCVECHSQTTATNTAIDGTDPTKHVNRSVEVSGAKITSYTDGSETCAAATCHGAGSPQWGGTVACGSCHAANNTLAQSHTQHYDSASAGDYALATNSSTAGNYVIQCGICHSPNGAGAISHSGGWVDSIAPDRRTAQIKFDGTIASGTYTAGGSETLDNGFYYTNATCAALYCHGNFGGNGNNATATWGVAASGACGTCHDVDTSAALDGGVHDTHVKNVSLTCDYCHKGTAVNAAGGIADKSLHVNQLLNWAMDTTRNRVGATATYSGAPSGTIAKADVGALPYGVCTNVYCHSNAQTSNPPGGALTYGSPNWNGAVNCGDCHNVGNAQVSGSHSDHVLSTKYAIGCSQCHQSAGSGTVKHADYAVDVAINASWGASAGYSGTAAPGNAYGGCTSVYCHSDGKGNFTSPTWGTTIGDCVSCHDNANATTTLSPAHKAHTFGVTATVGRNLGCEQCHADTVSNSTTLNATTGYTAHVDGAKTVKVAIDGTACNNIQCHSDGNFDGTVSYNNPAWNTTLGCTGCHGDGATKAYPDYADGGAGTGASNSHNKHVGASALACEECHATTSTAGTSIDGSDPTQHVDQTVDVSFKQGGSINGSENCSTTYCHGSGTPQWGGAALNCGSCHSGNSALANSHGVHYNSATLATAISTGNSSIAAEYVFQCGNCHNGTTHAGGEAVAGIRAAEVSLSGGGTYSPAGSTAASDRGFKYTAGTCGTNACHQDGRGGAPNNTGATLQWSVTSLPANCTGCHDNNAAAGAGKIMATGAHTAHVNAGTVMSNSKCEACHTVTVDATDRAIADKTRHVNGTRNVDVDANWDSNGTPADNWTAGTTTCANVYCHSNGKATPGYVSVDWTTTITGCTACHQGASAGTTLSGAHQAHTVNATATIGRTLGCADCHSATVSGNTTISTPANHVDKGVDVMSCATINCHSDGNYGATLVYKAPTWTANYTCDSCHGDDPSNTAYPVYANGGVGNANANSHVKHIVGASATCGDCHATTSTLGASINGSDPAQHVDNTIDVSNAAKIVGGFSGDTCSTISCHGGNDADWGDTLGCRDCHGDASADTDNFVYNDTNFAKVALDEWSYSGHGKSSAANYDVTGRAGAAFDTAAGTGDGCLYCHDGTIGHSANDGINNYFRLRQNGKPDLNGACLGCHATGSTGVDPDGAGAVYANKTSSVKIDKYHGGAKHNGTDRDAGRWCWDCHDAHGDTTAAEVAATTNRIQMIQKRAAVDPNAMGVPASLTTTDIVFYNRALGIGAGAFARDAVPFAQGVCNNCHTVTAQYTQTAGAGTHPTGQCTVCHKHSGDTAYDGNAFKGSGCNGCHGNSTLGNYWPDDNAGAAMPTANVAGRHAKHIEVLADRVYGQTPAQLLADAATDAKQRALCAYCHTTPGADGDHGALASLPADVNTMKNLWAPYTADDAVYSSDQHLQGGNDTCSSVNCHNNKLTADGTYGWYNAGTSACIMCHSNAPAESTHVNHTSAGGTYGRTIACADCHDAAASWATNTKPANSHIDGAFDVSGTVVLSYSGTYPSTKGTCGTNECHNSGRNGAPANNAYTWGTNDNVGGCNYCHQMVPGQGHQPHFLSGADAGGQIVSSFFSLGGGMGCNACHTHSAVGASAHIDKTITLAAGMTYNSAVLNLDVDQSPDYGTCTTTTCHQNGAGAAVKTPFWNRTPQSSDDCSLCHFNKAPESTTSHDAHIGATAAAAIKYNSATLNNTIAGEYRFTCVKCHGNTLANHLNSASWAAPTVNVAASVAYNAGADTCSNNACHTNGTGGAANLVANWTTGWVGESDSDKCNNCHGNSPDSNAHDVHAVGIHAADVYTGTTGLLTTSSTPKAHGDATVSTTISCNICHVQTVTMARNKFGTECFSCHTVDASNATNVMSVADKTKHVDGSKQVAFANSLTAGGFKSKAQLRDDITTVASVNGSWTRSGAYKAAAGFDAAKAASPAFITGTCSAVACHNGIDATWQPAQNNCMTCHTSMPK